MKEIDPSIVDELSNNLEIDLHKKKSVEELKLALANHINYLITHDLNKLMHILYRIDISERLLKTNLQNEKTDAGSVIAEMIVERQLQKIELKKQFRSNNDIPENEKW